MALEWHGAREKKRLVDAAVYGLNKTAGNASKYAKPRAPYEFGYLRGSIYPDKAKVKDGEVSVLWGSHDIEYAWDQEFGTAYMPGKAFIRQGQAYAGRVLKDNIAEAYKRGRS